MFPEAAEARSKLPYLFPFGVSILDPLHGDTLVVLVQRGDHRLVYSACREERARVQITALVEDVRILT